MRIRDFINIDVKEFSNIDNVRSIPKLVDGFKDSQRKAVYGMMIHGPNEIKVSQAAGKFGLATAYAHGEVSMADTIVGIAQNFAGSNNINLFEPIGQFGSILSNESASHRYIFTKPSVNLRKYIRKDDDCILKHRYEDDEKVEPIHFLPVIPMWVLNGSVGIGTGHSVKIFPRNPREIMSYIQKKLDGVNQQERTIQKVFAPYFEGWTGDVVSLSNNRYEFHGIIEVVNTTTLRVTELPIGYSVDRFKTILVELMDAGTVRDYDNNSTDNGFDFEIKVPRNIGRSDVDSLKKTFKLISRQTENVTLWNLDGTLEQYDDVQSALDVWIEYRVKQYDVRRLKHIQTLDEEIDFLENKKRFILVWNKQDNIGKLSVDKIVEIMLQYKVKEQYLNRLLQLSIRSLTYNAINELDEDITIKRNEVQVLQESTPSGMFINDITEL